MDLKKKPKDKSIFYSVEFPAMKASGNVDKIIWLDINDRPSDPTKETRVWWKKGDSDPDSETVTERCMGLGPATRAACVMENRAMPEEDV